MRNGGEFCTKDEMTEFYNDGLRILEFFKRKRGDYFSKKGYELLGIEKLDQIMIYLIILNLKDSLT